MANVPHGKAIWALPSGRKAKEPLADGMSPYPGYDKHGPTAVLKSVCDVNHADCRDRNTAQPEADTAAHQR